MSAPLLEKDSAPSAGSRFTTTHWSVVLAAGSGDSPQATAALEQLCRTYWYPLYAFVRRRGLSPEDAQDLVQEFFARRLAKDYVARADPQKGKFRSFLLAGVERLLCDERDKANRLKRGGGQTVISLDAQAAEDRYRLEPADEHTPEQLYERSWATALLERAARRLQEEYAAAGKAELFEQLTEFRLDVAEQRAYADVAARLGLSESAVKSAIHRLRQRHQELVREEIAQTLADPAELEEEVRYLLRVIGG
ncbi:MAG: sigma-70 family RNA polymerase sigma factor [Verrucomicrobia bacterium]|nr:sigma-70 family RNA polymerase sigma factor [Verrucomicrobiota bacterium]